MSLGRIRIYLWEGCVKPLSSVIARRAHWQVVLGCIALAFLIAWLEYSVRMKMSLTVLYAIPISVMAWFVGSLAAFVLSIFCLVLFAATEHLVGPAAAPIVLFFIGLTRITFYTFLSVVLARLNYLQHNLENLANARGVALAQEIAERERLEREMLNVSEREQRRIGRDLHDGLCQHLSATALAGYAHARSLESDNLPQAVKARLIVNLIEDAIPLARAITKGLHPVEMRDDGLMQALEEYATATSNLFGIQCLFECHLPVLVPTPAKAAHLYRIVQEGVSNAIRHGKATQITILLEDTDTGLHLRISDNGRGFAQPLPERRGMGLEIMAARAKFMGGEFSFGSNKAGGAELICLVPELMDA